MIEIIIFFLPIWNTEFVENRSVCFVNHSFFTGINYVGSTILYFEIVSFLGKKMLVFNPLQSIFSRRNILRMKICCMQYFFDWSPSNRISSHIFNFNRLNCMYIRWYDFFVYVRIRLEGMVFNTSCINRAYEHLIKRNYLRMQKSMSLLYLCVSEFIF